MNDETRMVDVTEVKQISVSQLKQQINEKGRLIEGLTNSRQALIEKLDSIVKDNNLIVTIPQSMRKIK